MTRPVIFIVFGTVVIGMEWKVVNVRMNNRRRIWISVGAAPIILWSRGEAERSEPFLVQRGLYLFSYRSERMP